MFSPSRQPATKATKKMLNMTNVCVLPSQVLVMSPRLTTGLKRRRNINCDGTSAIISTKASLKLNKSNLPQISNSANACKNKKVRRLKDTNVGQLLNNYFNARLKSPKTRVTPEKQPARRFNVSIESPHVRERCFSEDRRRKQMLTDDEIKQCEVVHQNLIEKIQQTISDTKMARFRGFVSPQKLYRKLLETTVTPSDKYYIKVRRPNEMPPHSNKDILKGAFIDPLVPTSLSGKSSLAQGYLRSDFMSR